MTAQIIQFPFKRKPLSREEELVQINNLIEQGLEASSNGGYVSSEEKKRRNYELEDFLGLPYGTLDRSGSKND